MSPRSRSRSNKEKKSGKNGEGGGGDNKHVTMKFMIDSAVSLLKDLDDSKLLARVDGIDFTKFPDMVTLEKRSARYRYRSLNQLLEDFQNLMKAREVLYPIHTIQYSQWGKLFVEGEECIRHQMRTFGREEITVPSVFEDESDADGNVTRVLKRNRSQMETSSVNEIVEADIPSDLPRSVLTSQFFTDNVFPGSQERVRILKHTPIRSMQSTVHETNLAWKKVLETSIVSNCGGKELPVKFRRVSERSGYPVPGRVNARWTMENYTLNMACHSLTEEKMKQIDGYSRLDTLTDRKVFRIADRPFSLTTYFDMLFPTPADDTISIEDSQNSMLNPEDINFFRDYLKQMEN